MLKLCKPRPYWAKNKTGDKYFGTEEEFLALERYCQQDVAAEHALSAALDDLSPFEQRIWQVDQIINKRGINCDLELVTSAIELSKANGFRGAQAISELTDGAVKTPNQVAKLKDWYNEEIARTTGAGSMLAEDLSADTVEAKLADERLPKDSRARKILELRQQHSKSSVKKYKAMIDRADWTGSISETLLYHGAHTGRWAGRGIQPQNYPRPDMEREGIEHILIPAILAKDADTLELFGGSVANALSNALRSALVAPEGCDLIGADYSNIEARVLFWLAGETKALDLLRAGRCLYKDMAATIYGNAYEDVTRAERQLGKQAILGLGYQMGAPKFRETCAKYGIEISLAFGVVELYRAKYPKVVKLWRSMNSAALDAMEHPGPHWARPAPIHFEKKGKFLFMTLPSGRRIAYPFPKLRKNRFDNWAVSFMHVNPKTRKWERTDTYGGKLTENGDQAIARDIMAEAMLRVEKKNYALRMSVHDELVASVPEGQGSIEEFEQLLCIPPAWAKGCPIKAEGWRGKRFRK
jgi:DNA polymerase